MKLFDPAAGTHEDLGILEYYATRNGDMELEKVDVALLGGIGYNIGRSYQVSLRYLHGLKPALTDQNTHRTPMPIMKPGLPAYRLRTGIKP